MEAAVLSRLSELGTWAYVLVAGFAFLEASAFVGVVVPGEMAVVFAGFLAGQAYLSPLGVAASASVGATLGDSVGYELGRHFGEPLVRRWRLQRRALRRAEEFFARHGGKAVFLGRFVGFLRAFTPFVAGVARMPYASFLFYNATGAVLWSLTATAVGYFAGANWRVVERWMTWTGAGIAAVAVLFLIAWWRAATRRRKRMA